jgi:hypothetical protein
MMKEPSLCFDEKSAMVSLPQISIEFTRPEIAIWFDGNEIILYGITSGPKEVWEPASENFVQIRLPELSNFAKTIFGSDDV